jgi:hypothetical protein
MSGETSELYDDCGSRTVCVMLFINEMLICKRMWMERLNVGVSLDSLKLPMANPSLDGQHALIVAILYRFR